MDIAIVPALEKCREIYALSQKKDRFLAYQALMMGTRADALPLGAFSPMGVKQPEFIDHLMTIGAEDIARNCADSVSSSLQFLDLNVGVLLVVLCEGKNGWTERALTDAEWRLEKRYDHTHRGCAAFDRYVTVQLWADTHLRAEVVRAEVMETCYRAAHWHVFGRPETLGEFMICEGRAACFAAREPRLSDEALSGVSSLIRSFRTQTEYPLCFAALYGDEAAARAGYKALGLPARAGFELALAEALSKGDEVEVLRRG